MGFLFYNTLKALLQIPIQLFVFDEEAYSHIGKIYEGVESYRMGLML